MNQAPVKKNPKGDIVRLPIGNVFVYLMPVREMINSSRLLPYYDYDDLCNYISVPANCTIGHLAKFLGEKYNDVWDEDNSMWTYPFGIYAKTGDNEYSLIPRPIAMEQLKLAHSQCYDSSEKRFNIYYTHEYPLANNSLITASPSRSIAYVDPSSGESSSSANSAPKF